MFPQASGSVPPWNELTDRSCPRTEPRGRRQSRLLLRNGLYQSTYVVKQLQHVCDDDFYTGPYCEPGTVNVTGPLVYGLIESLHKAAKNHLWIGDLHFGNVMQDEGTVMFIDLDSRFTAVMPPSYYVNSGREAEVAHLLFHCVVFVGNMRVRSQGEPNPRYVEEITENVVAALNSKLQEIYRDETFTLEDNIIDDLDRNVPGSEWIRDNQEQRYDTQAQAGAKHTGGQGRPLVLPLQTQKQDDGMHRSRHPNVVSNVSRERRQISTVRPHVQGALFPIAAD